ncbi:MAG: hypothetical protein ACJAQ4_000488 [Cryomorphaceae bacterium]|jgi:hypothetical protein
MFFSYSYGFSVPPRFSGFRTPLAEAMIIILFAKRALNCEFYITYWEALCIDFEQSFNTNEFDSTNLG